MTWMLGYTGIVELGRRGGAVGLRATVVWENDDFTAPWENEKGLHYMHKPGDPTSRTDRTGVLVTWKESGERMALHCPPSRIATALKHRKAKDDVSNEDWYWRKTAVRFARPWLPLSTDFAVAARADDSVVRGVESDGGSSMPVVDVEADVIEASTVNDDG